MIENPLLKIIFYKMLRIQFFKYNFENILFNYLKINKINIFSDEMISFIKGKNGIGNKLKEVKKYTKTK